MENQLIVQILGGDFNKNVEIAKRAFDSKYNLWRRCVQINDDNTYDIFWENIGVFESFQEASKAKNVLRRKNVS